MPADMARLIRLPAMPTPLRQPPARATASRRAADTLLSAPSFLRYAMRERCEAPAARAMRKKPAACRCKAYATACGMLLMPPGCGRKCTHEAPDAAAPCLLWLWLFIICLFHASCCHFDAGAHYAFFPEALFSPIRRFCCPPRRFSLTTVDARLAFSRADYADSHTLPIRRFSARASSSADFDAFSAARFFLLRHAPHARFRAYVMFFRFRVMSFRSLFAAFATPRACLRDACFRPAFAPMLRQYAR